MTSPSLRLAIYARVSSEQQAQHGTIQSQLAAVQEFVLAQGMKIDPDLIFADNGVSGATLARPQLDALRDKAAAGEIDRVLVLNPDRLARKYAQQLMLVEEFNKLGVEITFVNRQIAASPEDQLLLQIQGVISEFEREKIIERHRRGKLHKAQQGKVCVLSGAPYGYLYIPATDTDEARSGRQNLLRVCRPLKRARRLFHHRTEGMRLGLPATRSTGSRHGSNYGIHSTVCHRTYRGRAKGRRTN